MDRIEKKKTNYSPFSLFLVLKIVVVILQKKLSFNSKILIKTHQNHCGLIFQSNIKTTGKKNGTKVFRLSS